MSEEIIKVLDNLGEKFGIAIDWTNQNVLPYLQDLMSRFIAYKNLSAIIWIVVSVVFIILSITLGVIICKKIKKYYNDKQDYYTWESDRNFGYGFTWFCAGIIILAFIIILFCNINGIFKNVYLPEATVVEYINSLTSMGG